MGDVYHLHQSTWFLTLKVPQLLALVDFDKRIHKFSSSLAFFELVQMKFEDFVAKELGIKF